MDQHLMKKCQRHWEKLKINDESALKNVIKTIFQAQTTQQEALAEIYKLVLPEWDQIRKVNGFPEVGNDLWQFVCRKFIHFDRMHHPAVFAGGIWLNNGFQSNPELDPWELSFANCSVVYDGDVI